MRTVGHHDNLGDGVQYIFYTPLIDRLPWDSLSSMNHVETHSVLPDLFFELPLRFKSLSIRVIAQSESEPVISIFHSPLNCFGVIQSLYILHTGNIDMKTGRSLFLGKFIGPHFPECYVWITPRGQLEEYPLLNLEFLNVQPFHFYAFTTGFG